MPELLQVRDLRKYYWKKLGLLRPTTQTVHAVDGISFDLRERETLGLVGESGCGKSTAGRSVLRLIEPTSGEISFNGRDVLKFDSENLRAMRREAQMVFQDPFGSLNPRLTVAQIVEEPLVIHERMTGSERRERAGEMLATVGLRPEHLDRFPHEFSGGQRQRIGIARALMLNPRLLVADEPVSALDVSVQAQVLNLMGDLQERFGLAYLLIAHDLGVVRYICHRVAVMYLGEIVETAPVDDLIRSPLHPYTEGLVSAVPVTHPRLRHRREGLRGEVASPLNPPAGCRFHPRCPYAMPICSEQRPPMREVADQRHVACHLHDAEIAKSTSSKEFPASVGKNSPQSNPGAGIRKGGNP
ncbi:ABC transporter ATP-binding protein [Ferruginivarius sediminum]|uniref:Dipeptide ABC transporter ATP-binding protein n=1 Tax=Ferruginivarius sediminum TaxID=2661937 RepID=A0A369THH5_9PROT|nr:dipeptide ABC transporter ATP-binding protein [Ferruginivarius sediminum]RDD63835.1 dipeptide ABC transporter ATP-binding protein [Ferruginivarius sediminum]